MLVVLYGIYATGYYSLREVMPDLPATTSSTMGLIVGGVYVVFGLVLMFGTGLLAWLTYGREKNQTDPLRRSVMD